LVASYDFWPGNGTGLFSKEKISKEKSEAKRISGKANDVSKQIIYTYTVHKKAAPLSMFYHVQN